SQHTDLEDILIHSIEYSSEYPAGFAPIQKINFSARYKVNDHKDSTITLVAPRAVLLPIFDSPKGILIGLINRESAAHQKYVKQLPMFYYYSGRHNNVEDAVLTGLGNSHYFSFQETDLEQLRTRQTKNAEIDDYSFGLMKFYYVRFAISEQQLSHLLSDGYGYRIHQENEGLQEKARFLTVVKTSNVLAETNYNPLLCTALKLYQEITGTDLLKPKKKFFNF
ncbi:MAG: hypothetical protein OXQ96_06875, partial [Alphaproteobacteria bacterium]|nr:hypothetical protein [Alphaproteobacteria bacterium]